MMTGTRTAISLLSYQIKKRCSFLHRWIYVAEPTGFEPALFGVTVRCVKPGYTTVPRSVGKYGRGGKIRTRDLWFWRPPLYQLSYTPVSEEA